MKPTIVLKWHWSIVPVVLQYVDGSLYILHKKGFSLAILDHPMFFVYFNEGLSAFWNNDTNTKLFIHQCRRVLGFQKQH